MTRALAADLAAAGEALGDAGRPLADRLLDAFDRWAGRYLGPINQDLPTILDEHPEQLGAIAAEYSGAFADIVETALPRDRAGDVARTLISVAVGLKHQVTTREEFLARLAVAIDVVLLR